jgi:chemotaxis protein CheD
VKTAEALADTLPPRADVTRARVFLHAGQIFASGDPTEVSVILGSCVGVLLVDRLRRIGGASHYLLPCDGVSRPRSPRYGNAAITQLVGRMVALGSRREDLEAKVFGGASILMHTRPDGRSLGSQNVEVARRVLGEDGIRIVAEDVGGYTGRKIVFLTDEGHVWVKKL